MHCLATGGTRGIRMTSLRYSILVSTSLARTYKLCSRGVSQIESLISNEFRLLENTRISRYRFICTRSSATIKTPPTAKRNKLHTMAPERRQPKNKLQEWFPNTKLPVIISAPMLNVTNGTLAAQVSKAGGFGLSFLKRLSPLLISAPARD